MAKPALRVLIIEDTNDDFDRLIELLRKEDGDLSYNLASSLEAVRSALEGESWDLVISDQKHTDFDNSNALKVFKDLEIDSPLILVTDASWEEIASTTLPARVYDLVSKNNFDGLAVAIRRGIRDAQRRREQRRMEKVQAALIHLSNSALTAKSLDELYKTIHTTIGELMPADNFYICLYDATSDTMWYPYFVDEFDEPSPPQKPDNGLTAWILRTGKPLLALPDVFEDLVESGEVDLVGVPSIDWLGVPLIIDDQVIGALAVQSYTEGVRYSQKDMEILLFVSTQVAMVIDRKRAEEALKSESQFRKAIEDSILAGIIASDADGRQSYVNPAFCRMVGWSETELFGALPPYAYWPPEDVLTITDAFRVTTGEDALPSDFELVFQRRNGDRFDVYLLVSPLRDGQGRSNGWLASVYDITARKRDEETIRRQKARAEALARMASRLNTRLDLQRVLNTVCEETAKALNVPAVCVFLYDPRRECFEVKAGFGWPERSFQAFQPIPRRFVEKSMGRSDSIAVLPDVQAIPDMPNSNIYAEVNVRSTAATRLARDKSIVGQLAIFTFEKMRKFTSDELALLEGLGDLAAQAIVNARLFEDLERSLQQVRALNAVDVAINASLDLRVTLNILLDQVINLLTVDAADVWLYNPVTQELEFTVGRGFRMRQPTVTRMRLGDSYASQVVIERKLVHIQDLATAPEGYGSVNRMPNESLRDYVGVPLVAKGQVKGVLEIFQREEFELNTEWMELLDALAGQAAIAIDNATLFDQLQHSNEELTHALDATLESWVRILDIRNRETQGHTERLIDLSLKLARHIGLREDELMNIRRGALLHDIGMMRIPDTVLLKPGTLNSEEWEEVKQHPIYASQMISSISFLRPCIDIPYCHHERWDGSGYPRRLRGTQIPLVARLFSVVDVYDALHSPKPYRPAWDEDKVRSYFTQTAGVLFDPEIVLSFLDLL